MPFYSNISQYINSATRHLKFHYVLNFYKSSTTYTHTHTRAHARAHARTQIYKYIYVYYIYIHIDILCIGC